MIRTPQSDLPRQRARLIALSTCALVALFAAFALMPRQARAAGPYPQCSSSVHPSVGNGCLFGGFEMDGNRTPDSTNGIDWNTTPFPMALTHFTDLYNTQLDDGFKKGSFRNDQSTWTCDLHKSDPKDDIIDGNLAIRHFPDQNGDQFLYVDFSRFGSGGGTTFIEYNFSKATHNLTTNKGCNGLPQRETGDLSFEFGFTNGGAVKTIAVERWTCDYTLASPCSFVDLAIGAEGVSWEHAYNSDANKVTYGEAALDLTQVEGLGALSCHQFSKAWMDSHAAEQEVTEVKDLVAPAPFNGDCGNPSIVTTASQPVTVGGGISDSAALSGGILTPTGMITFSAYGPDNATCSGNPAFTSTVAVSGNGTYPSGSFNPTAAGTYRFVATYSGDANNNSASDACNAANESVVVSPVTVVVPPGSTTPPSNTGGSHGTSAAQGVAPAVALPRAGAGPQPEKSASAPVGFFGSGAILTLLLLAAVGGVILPRRRRQGGIAEEPNN
jgi:hypothetical protein